MTRLFPIIILLIALAGAVAGWYSVPHYRPPAAADENRLKERATEFYKATRLFDFAAMSKLYSPARQLSDAQELLDEAEERQPLFGQLDEGSQQNLHNSATSISPDRITAVTDGDWGSTTGTCSYEVEGHQISLDLERLVWIRTGGDWWVYTWKWPEIATYGNPSLEDMELLRERKIAAARQLARDLQQQQQSGQPPATASPANDPDAPATETGSGEPLNNTVQPVTE